MANIHYMKAGDLSPSITATLTYADGSIIDLTPATNPRFLMRAPGSSTLKVDGTAVLVAASQGRVRYDWVDGDTDTPGNYQAEWEFTIAGKKLTVPNDTYMIVRIAGDLG